MAEQQGGGAARAPTRLVVLTGGPGAGKTAVLELVRRALCEHVHVLPEAASILFGGGFPRRPSLASRSASQRAIAHIQLELERWVVEEDNRVALALCDRGVLDGLAYWPGPPEALLSELGTTLERELARYSAVIHLRPPPGGAGYDRSNPLRIESAEEAAALDARIEAVWRPHPRRFVVESTPDFLSKARRALALIHDELPEPCRAHTALPWPMG